MILGQILPGSLMGDTLAELAKSSKTIVEIGTWRGQGSTLCLANGLILQDQRMWTIESDLACWTLAKSFFEHEPRIRFIHGKALDVLGELPILIDLLLVDGADETASEELAAIVDFCSVIVLDDTNEIKNKSNRERLMKDSKFEMIHDHPEDRLGWSVFKRRLI